MKRFAFNREARSHEENIRIYFVSSCLRGKKGRAGTSPPANHTRNENCKMTIAKCKMDEPQHEGAAGE
jgi:hypothetical protein